MVQNFPKQRNLILWTNCNERLQKIDAQENYPATRDDTEGRNNIELAEIYGGL